MKRWKLWMLTGVLMLCSLLSLRVYGAEQITVQVRDATHYGTEQQKMTVILESESAECPMPADALDQVCGMRFSGQGAFMPIEFKNPGIYRYRLYQQPNQEPVWDSTVYTLTAYVTREQGQDTVAVVGTREGTKVSEFIFQNRPPASAPQTGDSENWIVWLGLCIIGLLGGTVILYGKKRM